MSGICDSLRANVTRMEVRGTAGELLVVDDLFLNVPTLPTDICIFSLNRVDESPRGGAPLELSPGLSFLWSSEGIQTFGSVERMGRAVEEFQRRETRRVLFGRNLFEYAGDIPLSEEIIAVLAGGLDVLHAFSLNAVNRHQDQIESSCRDLLRSVDAAKGRFGLADLARFLANASGNEFALLHLNESPPSVTVVASTTQEALFYKTLSDFLELDPKESPFDEHYVAERSPLLTIPLKASLGAELITNAGLWGKPLASAVSQKVARRVLILPITRPQGPQSARDERRHVLTSADVLITFSDSLNRDLLALLRASVETFSQHRYGARRINLLTRLQREFLFNQDGVNLRIGSSPDTRDSPSFEATLQLLLDEVLYTTSAHSVTVRLFNPETKELVVKAFAEPPGVFSASSHDPISIGKHSTTSVAAFMFLAARKEDPMIYLKRILPPVRTRVGGREKVKQRTFVPPEFSSRGLQAPLITREATRSQICFSLFHGQLPFGTLNLEAPFPAAFDRDTDFLNLVKAGIEKLFGSIGQTIDERWVISNASRSDAVHELWQFQESGNVFTREQSDKLDTIFPRREDPARLTDIVNIVLLEAKVIEWISKRWEDSVRGSALGMIRFYDLRRAPVTAQFLEATFVIIRNLVQNAVKHSEPSSDRIYIDDRPWYGMSSIPCLRIFYRSSRRASDQILNSLGITPIRQSNGRVAYGMYNVGLLTRLLGGNLHVGQSRPDGHLTIEINIPISGVSHESS